MIVAIVGAGGTGKDTIVDWMVDELGFQKIVNYTTRPMRNGEIAGKNYHFLSEENFKQLVTQGLFEEVAGYYAENQENPWFYGSIKFDTLNNNQNWVVILTEEGVKKHIKDIDGILYLFADKYTRKKRMINRGDNAKEVHRRTKIDTIEFYGCAYRIKGILRDEGAIKTICTEGPLNEVKEKVKECLSSME